MKSAFMFFLFNFLLFSATLFCRISGHWRQVFPEENGEIPGPRYNHYMCPIGDQKVLMLGGEGDDETNGWRLSNETWIFEIDPHGIVDNTGNSVNIYTLDDNLYMLDSNLKDVVLYNILGQKVVECNSDRLDLNPLPIGMYFLQYNESGIEKIAKIIKW